jgi:hypothetical protein
MTAPTCPHCGRPVEGIDPDLRRQYEAACERAGWPVKPAVHPRGPGRIASSPKAVAMAQRAACAAAARGVTRG